MAEIVAINISEKKGIPKKTIESGEFIENYGLSGDAHAGNWHRQVSFLAQESIDKMKAAGISELSAGKFAENITTIGIELHTLKLGTILKVADVEFEISQIGKECHHKCAIFDLVGDCIMPKEGIFAIVLKGGTIKKGDKIEVLG
jgi:MOSC domain-containing protein YiiM